MNDTQLVLSSPSPSLYTISGSIRILLDNKQARMMLRSQLKYEETNGIIIIESDKGIDYIARIVKLVARYIAAEVVFDEKTNEDIKDYKEREYKFDEYDENWRVEKNTTWKKWNEIGEYKCYIKPDSKIKSLSKQILKTL